jgi:HEAT repeat protein
MAIVKKQKSEAFDHDERKCGRDCEGLLRLLSNDNPTTRRWAVKDLVDCHDVSGALVWQLRQEEDASVREIILTTLTLRADNLAVAGLVECLRSEDASLRNEAIEAMKMLPDEVAPIMGGLLTDPDPDVRIFAVNVLESLRHELVEKWLNDVIAHDPHVNVCATAVDLLGEVGTNYSREALENLKTRFPDEPYIRFAADIALKRISAT